MFFGGNRQNVDNSKFYDLLGVNKDASTDDIKKAYKKNALKHHPDRGGDENKFKELSKAYEVLVDDNKRQMYDQMGEEGLSNNMNFQSPDDIFSMFFGGDGGGPFGGGGGPFGGGGGPFRNNRRQTKDTTDDVVYPIKVSLKDLYLGKTKTLKIKRNKAVDTGEGYSKVKCQECDGKGACIEIRQMGPMIQQIQRTCENCSGTGTIIKGKKIVQETKNVEIQIEKGMKEGDKIVKPGIGDETLNLKAGNLILILKENNEGNKFQRNGNHLITTQDILLCDALCGYEFVFKHIDDSNILIKSDNIIKNNGLYVVIDKGMPIRDNPIDCGNLYIKFNIIYPVYNNITPDIRNKLREMLPNNYNPNMEQQCENMEQSILMEQEMTNESHYESNDDHFEQHQNVQCNQQ